MTAPQLIADTKLMIGEFIYLHSKRQPWIDYVRLG